MRRVKVQLGFAKSLNVAVGSFVLISVLLRISPAWGWLDQAVRIFISFLVNTFVIGYGLVYLLDIKAKDFSGLILFSYLLSLSLNIVLVSLVAFQPAYRAARLLVQSSIGLLLIAKAILRSSTDTNALVVLNLNDILVMFVFFFVLVSGILQTVPRLATNFYVDSFDHLWQSVILYRVPQAYEYYQYLAYHSLQAAMIDDVGVVVGGMPTLQLLLSFLNFIPILTIYELSFSVFGREHHRIALAITLLFTFFSGFAWVYFLKQQLDHPGWQLDYTLDFIKERTYSLTTYGQLFCITGHVPAISAYAILMFIIALYFDKERVERDVLLILLLSGFLLVFLHLPELVFLSIFMSTYSILEGDSKARRRIAVCSTGGIFGSIVFLFLSRNSVLLVIAAVLMAMLILVILDNPVIGRARSFLNFVSKRLPAIANIILWLLLAAYLSWVTNWDSINAPNISDIYYVPLIFYGALLGVKGFLSVIGLNKAKQPSVRHATTFFLLLGLFSFLWGKLISFFSVSFFIVPFWEIRMAFFLGLATSVIGGFGMSSLLEDLRVEPLLSRLVKTMLIVAVILGGSLSTFLGYRYGLMLAERTHTVSQQEYELLAYLDHEITGNASAVFYASQSSAGIVALSYPTFLPNTKNILLLSSTSPDSVASILSSPYPSYIVLRAEELSSLMKSKGYLAYFLDSLSPTFNNSEFIVYKVPKLGHLDSASNIVLITDGRDYATFTALLRSEVAFDFVNKYSGSLNRIGIGIVSDSEGQLREDPIIRGVIERALGSEEVELSPSRMYYLDGDLISRNGGTIQLWVNPSSQRTGHIIWIGEPKGDGFGAEQELHLSTTDTGEFSAYFGASSAVLLKGGRYVPGNWYHLVFVYRDNGICKLYVNGQMVSSVSTKGVKTDKWMNTLVVGGLVNTSYRAFVGRIKSLMILREPLSDYQILENYLAVNNVTGFAPLTDSESLEKLIVTNFEGCGTFANSLVRLENETALIESICGSNMTDVKLPQPIESQKVFNIAGKVLMYYCDHNRKPLSPFLILYQSRDREILYVNIFPLAKLSNDSFTIRLLVDVIQRFIGNYSHALSQSPRIDVISKRLILHGKIMVNSTDLLLLHINGTTLQTDSGISPELDIGPVLVTHYKSAVIEANHIEISTYSYLTISGVYNITFVGTDMTVTFLESGKIIRFPTSQLKLTSARQSGFAEAMMKQPHLYVEGTAEIETQYVYLPSLSSRVGIYPRKIEINGTIEFKVQRGDASYVALSDFSWFGDLRREPPLLRWDELKSLYENLHWLLVSFLLLLPLSHNFSRRGYQWKA